MPLPFTFADVLADLDQFLTAVTEVQLGLPRPKEKKLLGDVLANLRQARAQAEEVVPKALKALQAHGEVMRAEAKETMAQIEAARQRLDHLNEQAKAAAAAPPVSVPIKPPAPVFELDPALGRSLRLELLRLLGGPDDADEGKPQQPVELSEIWEDWE